MLIGILLDKELNYLARLDDKLCAFSQITVNSHCKEIITTISRVL